MGGRLDGISGHVNKCRVLVCSWWWWVFTECSASRVSINFLKANLSTRVTARECEFDSACDYFIWVSFLLPTFADFAKGMQALGILVPAFPKNASTSIGKKKIK